MAKDKAKDVQIIFKNDTTLLITSDSVKGTNSEGRIVIGVSTVTQIFNNYFLLNRPLRIDTILAKGPKTKPGSDYSS